MEEFLLIALFILAFVGLPVGLACFFYFIPKRLGYPKMGKYLTIIFGLVVLTIVSYMIFEDQFFTKHNAKDLVEEQQIFLEEKFEIKENKSMSAIGDYYHTFTLKISEHDKCNAILKIKSANNFKKYNSAIDHTIYLHGNSYFGVEMIQNYETSDAYVRESFQPSGQEGYAPTFRRISIYKTKSELTFEDIDE